MTHLRFLGATKGSPYTDIYLPANSNPSKRFVPTSLKMLFGASRLPFRSAPRTSTRRAKRVKVMTALLEKLLPLCRLRGVCPEFTYTVTLVIFIILFGCVDESDKFKGHSLSVWRLEKMKKTAVMAITTKELGDLRLKSLAPPSFRLEFFLWVSRMYRITLLL